MLVAYPRLPYRSGVSDWIDTNNTSVNVIYSLHLRKILVNLNLYRCNITRVPKAGTQSRHDRTIAISAEVIPTEEAIGSVEEKVWVTVADRRAD